jgi:hypothetical protein
MASPQQQLSVQAAPARPESPPAQQPPTSTNSAILPSLAEALVHHQLRHQLPGPERLRPLASIFAPPQLHVDGFHLPEPEPRLVVTQHRLPRALGDVAQLQPRAVPSVILLKNQAGLANGTSGEWSSTAADQFLLHVVFHTHTRLEQHMHTHVHRRNRHCASGSVAATASATLMALSSASGDRWCGWPLLRRPGRSPMPSRGRRGRRHQRRRSDVEHGHPLLPPPPTERSRRGARTARPARRPTGVGDRPAAAPYATRTRHIVSLSIRLNAQG